MANLADRMRTTTRYSSQAEPVSAPSISEPTDEELSESYRIYLRLRALTVLLPAVFLLVLLLATVLVFDRVLTAGPAIALAFATGCAAIALFSQRVFALIEPLREGMVAQNMELRTRSAQLRAVHEAGVSITGDLSLSAVLQKVVDTSRDVVGARYGALAVVNETGEIVDFVVSGFTAEEASLIETMPCGKGLIGYVLDTGKPYRTSDIASDPNSCGFPPGHPDMKSFLGVPLLHKGNVVGNLYLTNKEAGEFTEQDQDAMLAFAVQAAIAIENARLYSEVQEIVVLKERERIGMDLHDGTIQAIYGVGLKLEDCIQRVASEPESVQQELDGAIENLNRIIREIRNYIFDLRPFHLQSSDLEGAINELLREIRVNTLIDTRMSLDADVHLDQLQEDSARQLLHIAREALANVCKHSQASSVAVDIFPNGEALVMEIIDNGRGLDQAVCTTGQGLLNMTERAQAMGGRMLVESAPGDGTTIRIEAPFVSQER
jgi:signal transduction histidine kinase